MSILSSDASSSATWTAYTFRQVDHGLKRKVEETNKGWLSSRHECTLVRILPPKFQKATELSLIVMSN
jgi:hypothetical protein